MAGHVTGTRCTLVLFKSGRKQPPVDAESWDLGVDKEVISDGVCGENRQRLDTEINFYPINLTCHTASIDQIKVLLDYDEDVEADAQPKLEFGLTLKDKKSGKVVIRARECVIDSWKFAVGGRTNRLMRTIPIRARYVRAS